MTMLWPKILNQKDKLPYQITFEQACLFNKWPDYGDVCASSNGDPQTNKVILSLSNKTETIEILKIDNAHTYPCKLWFDGTAHQCKIHAELMGKLAWAFNHQKTIDIIVRLMIGL